MGPILQGITMVFRILGMTNQVARNHRNDTSLRFLFIHFGQWVLDHRYTLAFSTGDPSSRSDNGPTHVPDRWTPSPEPIKRDTHGSNSSSPYIKFIIWNFGNKLGIEHQKRFYWIDSCGTIWTTQLNVFETGRSNFTRTRQRSKMPSLAVSKGRICSDQSVKTCFAGPD